MRWKEIPPYYLHSIVDGQAISNGAPGGIDIEIDGFLWILCLQEQQLGHNTAGNIGIYLDDVRKTQGAKPLHQCADILCGPSAGGNICHMRVHRPPIIAYNERTKEGAYWVGRKGLHSFQSHMGCKLSRVFATDAIFVEETTLRWGKQRKDVNSILFICVTSVNPH